MTIYTGNIPDKSGGGVSGVALTFARTFPYINNTPVETVDQGTSVVATDFDDNTTVSISVLFTDTNGQTYAMVVELDNYLNQLQPGLWQLRTAEPPEGGGKVEFAAQLNVDGTYHYKLDREGGGGNITFERVTVSTKTPMASLT